MRQQDNYSEDEVYDEDDYNYDQDEADAEVSNVVSNKIRAHIDKQDNSDYEDDDFIQVGNHDI